MLALQFPLLFAQSYNQLGLAPEMLIDKNNSHPYIIAVGETKHQIQRYFIVIENHLITVR